MATSTAKKSEKSPAAGKKGMARNVGLAKENTKAIPKDRGNRVTKKDGTTSSFRNSPALKEDVAKSVKKDAKQIKKAVTGKGNAGVRDVQKLNGLRASSRMVGRGSGLLGAASVGKAIGTELKKKMDKDNAKRRKARDMDKDAYKYRGTKGIEGAFKNGGMVGKKKGMCSRGK